MEQKAAEEVDVRSLIREVIGEFVALEKTKAEPAYKTELAEEKKRREQMEQRLNQLVEENRRTQARAEEVEREAAVRSELQRLGVVKVDLAYRAVKDDVVRTAEGQLVAKGAGGEVDLREYLGKFVNENPELLPARMAGGSGASAGQRSGTANASVDLERIKPGMDPEELERVRREVARVIGRSEK